MNKTKTGHHHGDILKHINWVDHKALPQFLEDNGIVPIQVVECGRRKFRIYDDAAYNKARALRKARDNQAKQTAVITAPAPKADPTLHQLHADVRALHEKIDLLLKELGTVPSFNAPYTNGHAQEAQQ